MLYNRGYGSVEFRSIEKVLTLAFSADTPLPLAPPPAVSRVITPPSAAGATQVDFVLGLPPVDASGHNEFHVNGLPFAKAKPYLAGLGETQLWVIKNDSKWDHPFHLHGFFFMPVDEKGEPIRPMAWKDTINVPINGTARALVTFDERPGTWMFHCHILDHAEIGLMGTVHVGPGTPATHVHSH
jgi:FtsP/CotA-like multicopper oxidase with cupredoxin domain